jgi:probable HAF family extracellular repeat protein
MMSHPITRFSSCVAVVAALLVAGCAGSTTSVTPAQNERPQTASAAMAPQQYHVIALSSLGGSVAAGISDNDLGAISGYSLLSDNATLHAALWYPGSTSATDLETAGGVNSAVEWPNHALGEVVGISQTSQSDPLKEQWSCSYPAGGGFLPYTGQECRGFVWRFNGMRPLGTLGGNNSFASGSNILGQVVGWAETSTHDATCVAPQVLGFEAVRWGFDGDSRALPPLQGDPDSAATAINDIGSVVGISGICENAVGALSAAHMVLWKDGTARQLPTLGGSAWNTPMMLNDEDAVVGFSDRPGDNNGSNFNGHAFLWTSKNGTTDLGTLAGDAVSYAYSINNRKQIVGQSCTPGCASSRAFLYEDGTMYDLNTLLDSSSAGYSLIFANDINDEGAITGLAVTSGGSILAFRLVPNGGWSAATNGASREKRRLPFRLRAGAFGRIILNFMH